MKRITVRIFQALFVATILFAAPLPPTAAQTTDANKSQMAAQTPAQPQRISVTVISVKPEMVGEFENLIKNETNPAIAKGGAKWRDVWQTAGFGNTFEYIIAAPIDSFAQYDAPGPLEKGLGKEGFAAWRAKASRLVDSVRTYALQTRPEMSYESKMTGPPKLAVVNFVHVAPGRNAEYENYIKNDLLPVIKRSDVAGYWFNQTVFGGDPNEYVTLTLHENYAELDKGPPSRRVLGADGAMKLSQKLAPGVVMHVERTVSRYVPELSYRPAQTANK